MPPAHVLMQMCQRVVVNWRAAKTLIGDVVREPMLPAAGQERGVVDREAVPVRAVAARAASRHRRLESRIAAVLPDLQPEVGLGAGGLVEQVPDVVLDDAVDRLHPRDAGPGVDVTTGEGLPHLGPPGLRLEEDARLGVLSPSRLAGGCAEARIGLRGGNGRRRGRERGGHADKGDHPRDGQAATEHPHPHPPPRRSGRDLGVTKPGRSWPAPRMRDGVTGWRLGGAGCPAS